MGDRSVAGMEKSYSEETAREIDVAVRSMIDDAYERAKALLADNQSDLEAGARMLLERETITPDDFPPLKQKSEPLLQAAE